MNEIELEKARKAINAGIDGAITTLRGSVEFRNAVEELLVGSPYEKPPSTVTDFEGLYGRLRSALLSSSPRPEARPQETEDLTIGRRLEDADDI